MARNGSGSYSLPEAAFVYNTAISETAVNSNFSDIASALTASLAKDGQTDPTANLPMAGFRHTGVDDATARNDYAAWGQVQDNAANYVTSAGSADAQTLTPTPAIAAYAAGQRFTFKAGSGLTNTGAMTLAVSGLAAKNVKALDGTDPDAGAVTGGNIAVVTYDGTNFVLHGQSTPASGRAFLGLGTAAVLDTGTASGELPTNGDLGALSLLATVDTAQVDDEAITNAKLAHVTTDSIKGRSSAGTGDVEDLSLNVVREMLRAKVHVQEQQSAATDGGGFTSGDWRTRALNTSVTNEVTGASLASSQVTLPAGDYEVRGFATAHRVNSHKIRVQDVTNTVTLAIGSAGAANASVSVHDISVVEGRFTLAGAAAIELQHQCQTTRATDGLGVAAGFSAVEVYSELCFHKVG